MTLAPSEYDFGVAANYAFATSITCASQMQPARHILGALLHEQGEYEEAEEVYRADIKLWKDNMWGLLGLKLCLEARGNAPDELAKVTALHKERSSRADVVPAKTYFCAQEALEVS